MCGKPGHYARNCRQNKGRTDLSQKKKTMSAVGLKTGTKRVRRRGITVPRAVEAVLTAKKKVRKA